ncbi:Mycolic acid cyclopropane synthetase-domain-containing protein [Aspergillus floccosus]
MPSSNELETSVVVKDSSSLWWNLAQNLDIGFAESYMLQAVECDDLVKLFQIYIRNWSTLGEAGSMYSLPLHLWNQLSRISNTKDSALKNASFHYDTSNDIFLSFLSEDMSYSCALWASPDEPLEAAQRRKVHAIIQKADINCEHHVLDVGGGWGFTAIEAVRLTGCRVTAITLSAEQKRFAERRIQAAGFEDRVEFLLCDYRDTPPPSKGFYDRIISIEMIEAVGKEFLDEYFRTLGRVLDPIKGKIVIQAITFTEKLHEQPKIFYSFLDKYVFPGGYLPSVHQLIDCLSRGSGRRLELDSLEDIGKHYVKTLRLWREKFIANWDSIQTSFIIKYGPKTKPEMEALRRRWIYYFSYCQAGFYEGVLGDVIMVASRRPSPASSFHVL